MKGSWLTMVLALGATVASGRTATASEYSGYINLGLYQVKEDDVAALNDVPSNNVTIGLGRVFLDVTKIGSYHNEFTFDLRDKYDSFGKVDDTGTRLVPSNQPELRQLAFKYPYEGESLYWAVGRFPVADAEVLGNDGADLGYRVASRVKVGLFGGLLPEQRYGRTVQIANEDHQGGLYAIYQDKGQDKVKDWSSNTYGSMAFVFRQPVLADDNRVPPTAAPGSRSGDQPEPAPSGTPTPASTTTTVASPTATDPPILKNYVFWYTNVVVQPSDKTRITYLSHIDLQPQASLRNLWASFYRAVTPKLSGTASVLHLDLTEYERQRDLRDTLPTSTYNEGRGDLRYRLTKYYLVDGDLIFGSRGADGKTKTQFDGKFVASSLAHGHLTAYAGGGQRKNFISNDTIVRMGATYFTSKLELGVNQQFLVEQRVTGDTYHPIISDLSIGVVLTSQLLASAEVEYEKDERATVLSALMSIGYRFNSKQLTPIRADAPRVEKL